MPNVIFKEDEKIEIMTSMCVTDVIDRENGNYCMCAVAINTEVNTENNLQLESFGSLFKLFRVMALVYKLVEKLEHKVKIKTKQVENKLEKNITDINLDKKKKKILKTSMLHQICGYAISSVCFTGRSMMT